MTADRQRLETLLRSAADDVAWPATPDLRTGVLARVAAPATPPARASLPARPSRRPLRLVRALAVAIVALLILAGIAAALGFRLPGLDIVFVDRLPPAGTGLALGTPVPLAEARDGEPPRVLVPASLPEPETAFVEGTGDRRMVTLAWRATGDQPVLPGTDLALTLTALAGSTEEQLLEKALGPGTTIEPVVIGGDRGWWIAGTPHALFVLRPDGSMDQLAPRLAGDTLLFVRDGTLYRIETALGRDAALDVAASLR